MVNGVDKNLIMSLRADVVWSAFLGIVIPLGLVALPTYLRMNKLPVPDAFEFGIHPYAFGLFFLLKILLDIKAMSLSVKWVWVSMVCCLPVYYVIYRLNSGTTFERGTVM